MDEKQNNQINTENISTDVNDQSRVFDDNGNRIVDKNTQFTENLTKYYENDQMKSKNTLSKEEKSELIDETSKKIKNSGMLFFSNSEIVDNNDLTNRFKNASLFVVIMLIICVVEFVSYHSIFDLLSIVAFTYSIVVLRKNNINGIYAGLVGSCCMILSFFILKIVLGILLGIGLLLLLKSSKNFINKNNPGSNTTPVQPEVKQEEDMPVPIENKPLEEIEKSEENNSNNTSEN
ncbi:MAG: hypothetical protein IKE89_04545 [Bacilli bacterium]|nr:hypothetical protein [Bacilli bacterium]